MNKIRIAPQKIILIVLCVLFGLFLIFPMATILFQSLSNGEGFSLESYEILFESGIGTAFSNSVGISALSALLAVVLAFIPAYAVNYTNLNGRFQKVISTMMMLPMLLPTITYGFAIIYSFGKQGLITRLIGTQLIDIYGIPGLMLGYVIYTIPTAFMLINNTMKYIDKKFMVVSRLMGDNKRKCFFSTVLIPVAGTLAVAFIQNFTLSFTDYGIPAALAGNVDLLSTRLYNEMLGSLPNFHTGSAVSILMLLPSVVSIVLVTVLNKHNIRYTKISQVELERDRMRDTAFGAISSLILFGIVAIFAVIFVMPLVEQWPYRTNFTLEHVEDVFSDKSLMDVYKNSLLSALLTALIGTVVVYACALVSARRNAYRKFGKIPDSISLVTNTIPGMVLGVAYLLTFKGTPLHNSFGILIICNIVHFFSSPYLLIKGTLEKLNASWETTAKLMGDSWLQTVIRIITPNAVSTLLEVFSFFFVNSMVTVSAVIFLVSTKSMVITAKIKELQHFASFNEIFVLSILILLTNLLVKGIVKVATKYVAKK